MREATGADLVLSHHDAALIADGGGPGALSSYPAADADRIVGHLQTVSAGDRGLTAHLTLGHTRGCTSWSGTVTIGGETLTFVLVCSLTVLADCRLVGEDEMYPGMARDYCNSVAHLRTLNAPFVGNLFHLVATAVGIAFTLATASHIRDEIAGRGPAS